MRSTFSSTLLIVACAGWSSGCGGAGAIGRVASGAGRAAGGAGRAVHHVAKPAGAMKVPMAAPRAMPPGVHIVPPVVDPHLPATMVASKGKVAAGLGGTDDAAKTAAPVEASGGASDGGAKAVSEVVQQIPNLISGGKDEQRKKR